MNADRTPAPEIARVTMPNGETVIVRLGDEMPNPADYPAPETTDEVDPSFDPKLIADLRTFRDYSREAGRWNGRLHPLTHFEIDALLAAIDERDAMKREAVETPEPEGWKVTGESEIDPTKAAVCACGGALVYGFGVWKHRDPSAPRDCIALPADHPSRAPRA